MDQEQVVVPAQVLEQRRLARAQRRAVPGLAGLLQLPALLEAHLGLVQAQAQVALARQAAEMERRVVEEAMQAQVRMHQKQRAQALGMALV